MKSSKWRDLPAVVCVLLAVLVIGYQRSALVGRVQKAQQRSDALVLPSPSAVYVASLGYRAALADLIYAHVLVAYGQHFQENRLFEYVGEYLDVVNRLDPKFREPYRFADTLLTLQPKAPPQAFYRKARQIQERGVRELPNDQELWLTAGQFLAYLAPQQLSAPAEREEYKQAGAKYLMRACELLGSNENIPYHCLTAASLLNADGNALATRRFLERVMSLSDNPEIQDIASNYLRRVVGEQAKVEAVARAARLREAWQADLPFVPRDEAYAVGPGFDAAACAGPLRTLTLPCATSWSARAALADDASQNP